MRAKKSSFNKSCIFTTYPSLALWAYITFTFLKYDHRSCLCKINSTMSSDSLYHNSVAEWTFCLSFLVCALYSLHMLGRLRCPEVMCISVTRQCVSGYTTEHNENTDKLLNIADATTMQSRSLCCLSNSHCTHHDVFRAPNVIKRI